jgi:hypothetical protein
MLSSWFALLLGSPSFALNLGQLQGEIRKDYRSPQSINEVCVIPKKWEWGSYKKGDLEDEDTLCNYDFYSNIGICPKYNSTNPGILLLAPNAKYSKAAIDASNCDVDAMGVKTEAKFKQSISCSYTPSILAYYQVSRLLGNVGRVPVAVIRSMDIRTHRELTRKAQRHLGNSNSEIAKTWAQYGKVHSSPRDYPGIVDSSLSQIFGALVDNVKNEEYYTDVSGRGSYDSRYQRFLRQKAFVRASSPQSIPQIVGASEFARVAQDVTLVKDTTDMVLIDTLLNQQDRIGNVHYKFVWYFVNAGKIERQKSEAKIVNDKLVVPSEEKNEMQGRTAALVKEMVLKDNDCGVSKDNMMRKISALEKVRHFSYQTYRRFIAFEKILDKTTTRDYFQNEMLFSSSNYASLRDNAKKAREILYSRCKSGALRFDVDLENYVPGGQPLQPSCEG